MFCVVRSEVVYAHARPMFDCHLRIALARNFFNSTVQPTSCLHYLLPPPRDPELLTRLRAPTKFPRSTNRTKKYQSSIRYGLSKFQTG